jgi:Ulp1 family protease
MATKESMFDADLVLFPFNANSMPGRKEDHWVLIVAHMAEKQLRLYDSLNYDMQRYCDYVEAALELDASKYEAEPNPRFNLCEWKVVTMPSNNQENGIDCGVFVCKTADAVSQGLPVEINKGNARQMRRTILAELLAAHERHSK